MLKDITLGQYFPSDSCIHKLDPRFKIIITGIFMSMVFSAENIVSMTAVFLFVFIIYILTKLSFILVIKSIKPILPLLLITSLFNIFLYEGDVVLKFLFIEITDKGLEQTFFIIFRIILLIIGTSVLTYTTSPMSLTDAIERLLSPLKKIHLPVNELAMMMTIAIRFIPTLIDETDKIISAQKSRGLDLSQGNLLVKMKKIVPIIVPLLVSVFKRAEDLALAMECRCYNGGVGRTRLKQLKIKFSDFVSLSICLFFLILVFFINKKFDINIFKYLIKIK
jgi:energy-coupling factor transport system permease protein